MNGIIKLSTVTRLGICCFALTTIVSLHLFAKPPVAAVPEVPPPQTSSFSLMKAFELVTEGTNVVVPEKGKAFYSESTLAPAMQKNLQVAFVLDATDSMSRDIQGVKDNFQTLVKSLTKAVNKTHTVSLTDQGQVSIEVAIVLYRDIYSDEEESKTSLPAERAVVMVTKDFEAASEGELSERLVNKLQQIRTADGIPAFQEQVDRGLYEALAKLPWKKNSSSESYTRLIYLAGDAPPWREDLVSEEATLKFVKDQIALNNDGWQSVLDDMGSKPVSLRGYATSKLIELATLEEGKEIVINAFVCNSGTKQNQQSDKAYHTLFEKNKPELLRFFNQLTSATGGKTYDLNNAAEIERIKKQAEEPPKVRDVATLKIKPEEVEEYRLKNSSKAPAMLVISEVLPASESETVYTYMDPLVQEFRRLPGVRCHSQASKDLNEEHFLNLAKKIRCDVVLWLGKAPKGIEIKAWMLDDKKSKLIPASVSLKKSESDSSWNSGAAAGEILKGLGETYLKVDAERGKALQSLSQFALEHAKDQSGTAIVEALLADAAFKQLNPQQAKKEVQDLAKKAADRLLAIGDQGQAYNKLLMASCQSFLGNDQMVTENLKQAYQLAQKNLKEEDLCRLEIEGDHAVFVERNPKKAIAKYEEALKQMKDKQQGLPEKPAKRIAWMLAGLYMGKWGVVDRNPELIDDTAAKKWMTMIMANWPESSEADFIRDLAMKKPSEQSRSQGNTAARFVRKAAQRHELASQNRPIANQYAESQGLPGRVLNQLGGETK